MSYLYYLTHRGKRWCIDATKSIEFGKYINHSKTAPNLHASKIVIDGKPRLIFTALRDITQDEELYYDYGERDEEVVTLNKWLSK